GTGKNRVLAVDLLRIGESARRLHELQLHARQLRSNQVHVAAEYRRQVRIDDSRIAARHQLHQRADLMRDRNLHEADASRELCQLQLVLMETIAVQQRNRARSDAAIECRAQLPLRLLQIERTNDVAVRAHAFVDLDDLLVQHRWQLDVPHEQLRTMLIANAQCIGEAAGDGENGAVAL